MGLLALCEAGQPAYLRSIGGGPLGAAAGLARTYAKLSSWLTSDLLASSGRQALFSNHASLGGPSAPSTHGWKPAPEQGLDLAYLRST